MPSQNASEEVPSRGWRCPDEEELAAYIDGVTGGDAKRKLERHVSGCDFCLKLVAGAAAADRHTSAETPQSLRARAEELAAEQKRSWRWVWALGPVLACLIAVAVFLRQPQLSNPATPGADAHSTAPLPAPDRTAAASPRAPTEPTRALGSQTATLKLLAPAGDAVLDRSHLNFEWTPFPNTSYYQVRITTTEGGLVWEGRSSQASARPPDKLNFTSGPYFVWVTAYLNNGRTVRSDPLEFRIQSNR